MGKCFSRFASGIHVIDFWSETRIYLCKMTREKRIVPYLKIKSYKLIRQGKALRLPFRGAWVSHPSGFEFVDINRPFVASTLEVKFRGRSGSLWLSTKVKETR